MPGGSSAPDPFVVADNFTGSSYRNTTGLTPRPAAINPALKTLVLICACSQSVVGCNTTTTLYPPSNSTVVDQFNLYDGQIYPITGPLLGATYNPALSLGPGNVLARVADTLVTNGKFDRVIIATVAVGSTKAVDWGYGVHYDRGPKLMARLASKGITPSTPGATFCCVIDDGNDDFNGGTSGASFAASVGAFIANMNAAGFSGRDFINLESGVGQTSNVIRTAQAGLVDGVTKFAGADIDAVVGGRVSGDHLNDTSAANSAAAIVTAMHASGLPF